ncbi:MAG TPA: NAD(P)/FAD-dependent oxidoreductase [Allosphingosinicella sp.]|jgi:cation diffusion facilitator CzcD-associated flavoprotein CzcO|nr:NAD(P)/FAD-dependent oxidoreductase [Allosphingosinicella sp.]
MSEHFDVLIVGAGLSGIDAAYRLQTKCPGKSWCIFEARDAIGGTWDLFRYPGVRSDSDMYTLGFPFRPWRGEKSIVEGPDIRAYIEETAREFGIDRHIRFRHRIVSAAWSSGEARWTVEADADGKQSRVTCGFLFLCSGYYRYEQGYRPEWPGEADFRGTIVHPQHWPEGLDYSDKKVIVIGSGATAMTLVPAMADTAAHVTMLQRSPSYVVSRPSRDPLARRFGARFGRLKNASLGLFFFNLARRRPEKVRAKLLDLVRRDLPTGYDVERHFGPAYNPWDQRLCLVPDGDLFEAIRGGKVSIVTDEIERFTPTGVRLKSGDEIEADVVVAATGLVMKLLGGIALNVDGEPVNAAERFVYKGMMLNGVPNLALSFGYINASWTLKCDLTALYVCRLLNFMDRRGCTSCAPRLPDPPPGREPMLDFTSGYVRRAAGLLPAQGEKAPWRVHQNYLRDLVALRFETVTDGVMEFRDAG